MIALLRGLTDPYVNLSMGQTAENLAYRFNISRQEMDAFSAESHKRVAAAQDKQYLQEVVPAFSREENLLLLTMECGVILAKKNSQRSNLFLIKSLVM